MGSAADAALPPPLALSDEPQAAPNRAARPAVLAVSARPDARGLLSDRPASLETPGGDCHRVIGAAETCEKLVVNGGLPRAAAEQYRRIAASLHHRQCDRGVRVVMVGSAVAGEGKTLTCVNLALTLSESYGRRVLLIDADLRRPMLFKVLGASDAPFGLSGLLRATDDQQLVTVPVSDRLELAPSGPPDPDPMRGLTSERMRRVITDAAARYDWVIIDTPPVAVLADANLLTAMVDGAILVIAAGRTPLALVQQAIEALGRDRILGVVLNQVEPANMPLEYGYRYRAYGGAAGTGA
jgi:capsular exopolysaccharide synthesis family protein